MAPYRQQIETDADTPFVRRTWTLLIVKRRSTPRRTGDGLRPVSAGDSPREAFPRNRFTT